MTERADFFEPGHTYRDGHLWAFRCDAITTHPDDGERTALGWKLFNGEWNPYAYVPDDWEISEACGWIDIPPSVTT